MKENEEIFYLYRHIRLDKNQPFYVGIGRKYYGTKYRGYQRAYSKLRKNKIWNDIINKTNYEVEIILESNDLSFIKEKEIEFIKVYGRIDLKTGILANLTYGEDGCGSYKFSPEQRKKMALNALGNKNMLGKTHSEESKRQMSLSSKTKRKVLQTTINGDTVRIFDSVKETDLYGFISSCVNRCCKGRTVTHKNFKWQYYEH